jgi:phospho-acceptor domain-containing protein
MPVDISSVLHVLAHELRTPAGIAQGYLRMLLEERLTEAADQRRALEQTQKALARLSELTAESSRLARWLDEQHGAPRTSIDAHVLVTRVVRDAGIEPLRAKVDVPSESFAIATVDGEALAGALVALVKVTAREMKSEPCAMVARLTGNRTMDVLIGHEPQLDALAAGPEAPGAGPLAIERGGVGLSLVMAIAILETHDARHWTIDGLRTTVGIRFPFAERSHQ